MALSFILFKTLIVTFGLFRSHSAQEINGGTNLCRVNLGLDNFSCEPSEVGGVNCFNRTELCNNSTLCAGGEDENFMDSSSSLQCKFALRIANRLQQLTIDTIM